MRASLNKVMSSRSLEMVVCLLIVGSLIAYTVSTLPDLSETGRMLAVRIELAISAIFTLEYALRVFSTPKPLRYTTSFIGIVDVLATLPLVALLGPELAVARSLRLFRLFRLVRIARYVVAADRLKKIARDTRDDLILFGSLSAALIFIAGVVMHLLEKEAQPQAFGSVVHGIWWAIVSLTTVGYGDVYPVTAAGKVVAGLIVLAGVGIVAVPAGLVAGAVVKAREESKPTTSSPTP